MAFALRCSSSLPLAGVQTAPPCGPANEQTPLPLRLGAAPRRRPNPPSLTAVVDGSRDRSLARAGTSPPPAEVDSIRGARSSSSSSSLGYKLPPLPTTFPPLPDLTLPPYEQFVLPNGLRVFLLEDHELGLVGGQLLLKGGAAYEPSDKVGLARMTAAVQRLGGTPSLPADMLDAVLEDMAASIELSASTSSLSASFRCLHDDLPSLLPLFHDVLLSPRLPSDRLEFVRAQVLGGIARRNDDPGRVASRELVRLLYGPHSPVARQPTEFDTRRISLPDLTAFHRASFARPQEGVLGVWGDFDSAQLRSLLVRTFAHWTPLSHARAPAPAWGPEQGVAAAPAAIYLVDRPGLTQGYVRMGELGVRVGHPDVFALDLLNSLLNGFGGRLFDQVRSRQGLAYSVSGAWTAGINHRGAFMAGGETSREQVVPFIAAVQQVLTDATLAPPSPQELQQARQTVLNSFVFNFADSGAQLGRVLAYDLFGIDQAFVFEFRRQIDAMQAQQVQAAAARHLHVRQQPILVVADAAAVEQDLSALGLPITRIQPA